MNNFHGVIRHNILTKSTWIVAQEAIGGADTVGKYPGKTFLMDSEQGQALAGTPHVFGIIYSLWQHPADWGTKKVHSISVFGDDEMRFSMFIVFSTGGNVPSWAPTPTELEPSKDDGKENT